MELMKKVRAYQVLTEMMKETWEFSFIYPLTKLLQELTVDYEFFHNEELKLVAEFGKKEEDGKVSVAADGSFSFKDAESMEAFGQRHKALQNMETPAPQRLSLTAPPSICGAWLQALAPFCSFTEEVMSHE